MQLISICRVSTEMQLFISSDLWMSRQYSLNDTGKTDIDESVGFTFRIHEILKL